MESKHGGSPASGIVMPAGIEQHTSTTPGGIVVPELARKREEAEERKKQFERRRLALEVMPVVAGYYSNEPGGRAAVAQQVVADSLCFADELIAQTGGVL